MQHISTSNLSERQCAYPNMLIRQANTIALFYTFIYTIN